MRRSSRHLACTLAVVGVVALPAASPLRAQERIELISRVGQYWSMVEVDASVSGFGDIRHTDPLPVSPFVPLLNTRPLALAGGRYVVWGAFGASRHEFFVFDRRTRVTTVPGGFAQRFVFGIRAIDPVQPRLFAVGAEVAGASIWMLDARSLEWRLIQSLPAPVAVARLAYAPGTDLLFAAVYGSGPGSHRVLAIPVDHAGEVRELAQGLSVTDMAVDRAGSRLWLDGVNTTPPFVYGIRLLDAGTGAVLREAPRQFSHTFVVDEPRGLILVPPAPPELEDGLTVLDANTLATVAVLPAGRPAFNLARSIQIVAGRWMTGAYIVRTELRLNTPTCHAIEIDAIDPAGVRRQTVDVLRHLGPGRDGCSVFPVLVRSPFAPAGLSATVAGRRVTLDWQTPGDVSEFEIQAGTAPGATALTQRVGLDTTAMTFDNVPPGVYYARIRAFNEVGGSPVSNEIRITVP